VEIVGVGDWEMNLDLYSERSFQGHELKKATLKWYEEYLSAGTKRLKGTVRLLREIVLRRGLCKRSDKAKYP